MLSDPRSLTRGCVNFGPSAVSPAKALEVRSPPRGDHAIGHPSGSVPTVLRDPNCSAVRVRWQSAQRQRMLLSLSDPPRLSGTMWSGTVASRTKPFAAQSRQSGSAFKRRNRWTTALRPRFREIQPVGRGSAVPQFFVTTDFIGQPFPASQIF